MQLAVDHQQPRMLAVKNVVRSPADRLRTSSGYAASMAGTSDRPTGPPPSRPPFARSALATFATNIAVAGLSFASVLITARALGAEGRGAVAFLTTVAFITSEFASFGVQQSNANFAARRPDLTPALATTSLAIALVGGGLAAAVVAALMLGFSSLDGGAPVGLIALVLASLPMLILQVYLQQLVMAQYAFRVANIAWLLTPGTSVAVSGALALADQLTVGGAVAAWVGGQSLTTIVLAHAVARRLGGFGRLKAGLVSEMLGFGLKAHLGRVMLVGNYRLDQWILGIIAGPRELGLYSVAVAWSEALFFLPTALAQVQRPDLVRDSPERAQERAAVAFRVGMLATIVMAGAMIVFAPFLCVSIFGESFRGSIAMLRVLSIAAIGIAALKLLGNALTAQGKPLLETGAVAVAFVSIVILDLLLIPEHGGLGAAWASVVAYSAGGAAAVVIFVRRLGGSPLDLVPRPAEVAFIWRRARRALRPPDD